MEKWELDSEQDKRKKKLPTSGLCSRSKLWQATYKEVAGWILPAGLGFDICALKEEEGFILLFPATTLSITRGLNGTLI